MEIERKFLVKDMPKNMENYKCKKIKQGYISTSPVIRIRQYGDEFILTVKGKGSIAREEYEINIDEIQFEELKKKVDNNIVEKDRYLIPIENNYTAELDVYHGFLDGLFTVEVEFKDIESCNNFVPPSWFGEDVSKDSRYHNSTLSKGLNPSKM